MSSRGRSKRQAIILGLLLVVTALIVAGSNAAEIKAIRDEAKRGRNDRRKLAHGLTAAYHRTGELDESIDNLEETVKRQIHNLEKKLVFEELALMVQGNVEHMVANFQASR